MLVFWTPSVAPQWHLIELKENTIQYKFWSFHHQNTGSLCYYYEKEFNYFLFGKYHLQGNNKVVAVWGDKRVACNSFVWSLLLLEALFHLKTVFQITVSETRLVSSKGNSKRQLRKEWVFPLPVVVTLRQFHGMRQSESDANKTAFWFQNLISPPEMYARVKYAYSGSWDISCHAHVYVNHMEQRKHLTATNWKDSSPNKISKQRILDMNKIEQIISCLSLLILLSTFAFRLHCKVFKQFLSNLCSCLRDLYVTVVSL